MLSVQEFSQSYPQYSIDFDLPLRQQQRVYDAASLVELPEELVPNYEYRVGGRGRPNLNQTLTHSQCKICKRVLRNDFFHAPPSMIRQNIVFTYCLTCTQEQNSNHYQLQSSAIRRRRIAIWEYLAPQCAICGFNKHNSAMDMHHMGSKDAEIATLITEVTFTPNSHRIEKLLREASGCVPLCSNCHRMLHADAIDINVQSLVSIPYKLIELARILEQIKVVDNE